MAVGDTGLQPVNLFMTLFPFILSTLIVGTRLWRRVVERKFAIEDVLIAVAQVLLAGLTAATWKFIMVSYTGYRLEDIPKGVLNTKESAKWRYVNAVIYNPLLGLIKLSFLLTLIKLQAPSRIIRISLWALFAVNVAYLIAGTLVAMLNCLPIPKFWNPKMDGYCINKKQYIYSTIIVTIITDILVTIMPAWILYGLQMPKRQKVTIICFLSLGLIVTAIASYRLSYFVHILELNDPLRTESPYNVRTPLANIEGNLAAIAACGPTLKWILGRFIPFFNSDHSSKDSKESSPHGTVGSSRSRKIQRSKNGDEIDIALADDDEAIRHGSAVEMKNQIGWKNSKFREDSDAQSDEQGITGEENPPLHIMKTVEWHVRGRDTPTRPRFMV